MENKLYFILENFESVIMSPQNFSEENSYGFIVYIGIVNMVNIVY